MELKRQFLNRKSVRKLKNKFASRHYDNLTNESHFETFVVINTLDSKGTISKVGKIALIYSSKGVFVRHCYEWGGGGVGRGGSSKSRRDRGEVAIRLLDLQICTVSQ